MMNQPYYFCTQARRERSPNVVASQNQHYPSMSEAGNILAVWESRGAYRMMSLILLGNLSHSASTTLYS